MSEARTLLITHGTRRAAALRLAVAAFASPLVFGIALVSVNVIGYFWVILTAPVLYALWTAVADVAALVRSREIPARPSYRWFLASVGVLVVWLFVIFRGLELVFGS